MGDVSQLHAGLAGMGAVAFDLDGVLYDRGVQVPGAARAVTAMRSAGLLVRFVTNTTSLSRRLMVDRLEGLGIEAKASEVMCPAPLAAGWLRRQQASASLFVPPAALEDFDGVAVDDTQPDAVVIGDLGADWSFASLNHAFRLVHEGGARLIGLGRSRYWNGPGGLQLDVGPFLAAIEQATGQDALVFGKPDPAFFAALLENVRLPAERVAMVGDDIVSDVGGANDAGLLGILVRTGKFRQTNLSGPVRPSLVVDSVADLVVGS